MATRGALAAMEDGARKRIAAATATLAARFDVAPPAELPPVRDPEWRAIASLDASADFLDRLVEATELPALDGDGDAERLTADAIDAAWTSFRESKPAEGEWAEREMFESAIRTEIFGQAPDESEPAPDGASETEPAQEATETGLGAADAENAGDEPAPAKKPRRGAK